MRRVATALTEVVMSRLVLSAILLFSAFVVAQHEPSPATDLDWQVELNLFNRFFQQQDVQGAYLHAQKMLDIVKRKNLGARELGSSEWCIGEALRRMEKLGEAESHLRESLKLRESVLPPSDYRVLQSVDALANVLYLERKYQEAQPLMERAIAGYSAMADRDGPDECHYGQALQNLGVIESVNKNLEKAEGLLIRATKSFAEVGLGCGQMHTVYWSLAGVYWLQNRTEKVEEVYKTAIKVFTPEPGADPDYHYGLYLSCLAGVYSFEKQYDRADALYKQAIESATHVSSDEGPTASASLMEAVLRDYRGMLESSGRKAELAVVDQQLAAARAVNTADARNPGLQWESLTEQWQKADQEKRYGDAERDLRKAVEVARLIGTGDPRYIRSQTDLAFFVGRTRPDEALRIMEQTYADAQHNFSNDLPVLGRTCGSMATFYVERTNPSAEATLKQCVQIWSKYPNRALPWYRSSLEALASFYISQNRFSDAESPLLESLGSGEQTFGPDNFQLASTVERLGYLYSRMGKYEKAEPYYRRNLALFEKQFGNNSTNLSGVLYTLAEVMRNLGRPKEADELMARREQLGKSAPVTQK